MLLVKQNVLKSFAKLPFAVGLFALAWPSYGKTDSAPDFISMITSLVIVLGLIFLLAFVAKKLRITPSSKEGVKLVANLAVGTKERVVIVEVQGEQFMLGVTPSQINLLHKLPENISQTQLNQVQAFKTSDILSLLKKGKS